MECKLPPEHVAAVRRRRRLILNYDVISGDSTFGGREPAELVQSKFYFIDKELSQVDSVWWCWGEGNQSPWPSKTMPLYDDPAYRKWAEEDVDIAQVFFDASKARGIEALYNYRINGSDNDLGCFDKVPMKQAHAHWLIWTWGEVGYWNFAEPGVREFKLGILREIAERFDCDGFALDFGRVCPVLPPGRQWENRESLTGFMREVRSMTLEVAQSRGRPFLVGVRLQDNLVGCHFDGLDLETWVREKLVDLLALGVRSFEADIAAFRRITEGTSVKLYPCLDDHHASDGYQTPPIEVYRGVAANLWQRGADGIQLFNFNHNMDFPYGRDAAEVHALAFCELGSPEMLKHKDKVFVIQRRGGGHGPKVVPNPEDWTTPRWMYINTNMFAQLPAALDNLGKADALLTLAVADDVAGDAERIEKLTLRVLLSDRSAEDLREEQTTGRSLIRKLGTHSFLYTTPPARDIVDRVQVRLNNVLLGQPSVEDGWLVYRPEPNQFAVGDNLVGILATGRDQQAPPTTVEKLEVHVRYK